MFEGFPERMMGAVPADWFMTQKLSKPGIGLDFMDPAAFAEYVRCFKRPRGPTHSVSYMSKPTKEKFC
jgi:hypothetical protein